MYDRYMCAYYDAALCLQVYSACVIAWRVYNFNDCQEAADELQQVRIPVPVRLPP